MKYADINRLENLIANELSRRGYSRNNTATEAVGAKVLAASMTDAYNNLKRMGKSPTAAPSAGTKTLKSLVENYATLAK